MRIPRHALRLIVGAAIFLSGAGLVSGQQPAAADTSAPPIITLSQLPECNGVTQGSVHLIDATRGIIAVEPPAGFNPVAATNPQLACYSFPRRPAGGAALASWTRVMSAARHYVLPQFGGLQGPQIPPQGSVCCSYNTHFNPNGNPPDYPWSGYAVSRWKNTGWTNLTWTETAAEWVVPYGHNNPSCYNTQGGTAATDSAWVGMGGDGRDGGGSGLIQGGTTTFDWPTSNANFWWFDYTTGIKTRPIPISNLAVAPGDDVYTDVSYETGYLYHAQFYYQNLTQGTYTTWGDRYTPYVDLSSTEFINEDQPSSFDFVNFGTVPFVNTFAWGTWGGSNQYTIGKSLSDNVTLSKFSAYKLGGDTSDHLVAWPADVNSGGGFTDYATANDTC